MRTDASVINGDPGLLEPSRECPTAAQLVELLQTANPINWKQLLQNRLSAHGVTDPADLTPAKLAEFRDYVFSLAKQAGIKDPAAWIIYRAQLAPQAPVSKTLSAGQVKPAAGQPKSADSEAVALQSNPATACAASAPCSPPRTPFGITKAEVLSRAKAAVAAGECLRIIGRRLACAQEDFHASQREIGRAIGRSASWVNRLLKWRRSGYDQRNPFGPTTRAGRTAQRSGGNNYAGECGGGAQAKDDGTVKSVGRPTPADQAAALMPLNKTLPSASAPTEVLPGQEAANREADGIEVEANSVESGDQQSEQQNLPPNTKLRQKLTAERMLIVIEAFRESPIRSRAADKAGIHPKTLAYWLKCSQTGQDGYDIEWEGFQWKFHEACKAASDEPYQMLLDDILDLARGRVTYKVDQDLVDLGMEGADAYARDDNGDPIEETRARGNVKMLMFYLQTVRPERWAKRRKRRSFRSGGVLVIGECTGRSEKNCSASIKARRWKSAVRKLAATKANDLS
jgi:hypothetical protein